MKRREFIRTGTAGAVAAGAGTGTIMRSRPAKASPLDTPGYRAQVSIAASNEPDLPDPVALDAPVTYSQVRDVVWRALNRDTTDRNLKRQVTKDSWVVLKPNIVTIPISYYKFPNGRKSPNWNRVPEDDEGVTEHWGLVTDLRVIKAVAEYLIEHVGPKRLTIAEGGVWYSSGGKLKPDDDFIDGWHCTWDGFDGLSYAGIVDELQGRNGTAMDIVDLNEDEPVYVTDYDPYDTGRGAFQFVPAGDDDGTSDDEPTHRKGIWLPRTIMERDILITCPVIKTHGSVGTTLFMKNFIGCVHSQHYTNANLKVPIHKGGNFNLARGVADLGTLINPDYGVAEGFWATMSMHWGQNGVNIHHNIVVAGADVVAAESVANMAMGYNPLDFDPLRWCNMKKLGEWRPDRIDVTGPDVDSVKLNYDRAANKYVARGVRKWLMVGPLRKPVDDPQLLSPRAGDRLGRDTWRLFDGDAVIDEVPMLTSPLAYKDNLLYPIPGSEEARKNSVFYLSLVINTERKDLVGQLLVGIEGGSFRPFFDSDVKAYHMEALRYDPTPSSFCKFHSGTNPLIIEVTKTAGRGEPVKIAANICDLDGDRLFDITLDPPNE